MANRYERAVGTLRLHLDPACSSRPLLGPTESATDWDSMALDIQDLERSTASHELRNPTAIQALHLVPQSSKIHILPTRQDFAPSRQVFLRRLLPLLNNHTPVTLREIQIRFFLSIYWIWIAYLMLDLCNALLSIFFSVILRLDTPNPQRMATPFRQPSPSIQHPPLLDEVLAPPHSLLLRFFWRTSYPPSGWHDPRIPKREGLRRVLDVLAFGAVLCGCRLAGWRAMSSVR
ncbi:hypothetical protein PENPOL_c002G09760 [Penicillium polonicum]|uniref:Wax synthase domain-containing protein n=1 Tax=Penicillium polonicum TaxID=60169 RepID=A0A1V6NWH6_PENPO|nr:hypothetical protein PENPOL_c002G09760 [Penicillium polonicum]